ncbi:uncharacterized protein FOBCDRAFT_139569, partial [Fusarium oxysporum Fo47]|uniref:uncharacterized protein n=1 Tax=Fusarium oxysporum Fo47 TaxID=660027 RepID=UPI0028699408
LAVIDLIYSRNDALHVNPQGGQSHLSEEGSDWLWAIMACFSLAFRSELLRTTRLARLARALARHLYYFIALVSPSYTL